MKNNFKRLIIIFLAMILLVSSVVFSSCNKRGGNGEIETEIESENESESKSEYTESESENAEITEETGSEETETQETESEDTESQTDIGGSDDLLLTGMSFSSDIRVLTDKPLSSFPVTVGFKLRLDPSEEEVSSNGILFSNTIRWGPALSYEITGDGNPSLKVEGVGENSKGNKWYKGTRYTFDKINVCTGEAVELYFVIDVESANAHCYFNGELAQTLSVDKEVIVDECKNNPFVVGGSMLGSNYDYFRGELYAISVWSDRRTDEEISDNTNLTGAASDHNLITKYVFTENNEAEPMTDRSNKGCDLHTERLWLDSSEVEKPDGDYCFAVIGDTQSLVQQYPERVPELYDWLLANKDTENIQYVIGLGDITNNCTEEQFAVAKENIYKLNGKIPYSLVPGNHDKDDFKSDGYYSADPKDYYYNKVFYEEPYLSQLDGWYGEGDVTSSYKAFSVGDTKWLIVNLDFGATDAVLEWAGRIIEAHKDHRVIVVTHAYLYRDGTTIDKNDCYAPSCYYPQWNDGDEIFEQLISKHENIELVVSGHDPHDHVVCTQVKGDKGNTVTQLLVDPQYMDAFYGPTGMVALFYFSEDTNTLTVRYYSTVKDMYGSELSQFSVTLG